MENAAFLAGIAIAPDFPLIAELAIAFDVPLLAFIVALLTRIAYRQMGTTEVGGARLTARGPMTLLAIPFVALARSALECVPRSAVSRLR